MIQLFTSGTPNGHKVSILLEETGIAYELHPLDLASGAHKSPWFLKLNPNGRIPVLVTEAGEAIFESGAILLWIAERTGRFLPASGPARARVHQWLMFQMSAIGPMFGQAIVFRDYFPERLPSVIERFSSESQRLLGVLDQRLSEADYLAGEYSIADMATFPWVRLHDVVGLDVEPFPHVRRWLGEIGERPAVRRGLERPPLPDFEARQRTGRSILTK